MGAALQTLEGYTSLVSSIAFSYDGKLLASALGEESSTSVEESSTLEEESSTLEDNTVRL
jgi:WD40 repeat protein